MRSRKEMKKSARKVVKKHYFFLILVCIISSFIGSEFTSTLSITRANENIIFVQEKNRKSYK